MARMTDDEILAKIAKVTSTYRDSDIKVSIADIERIIREKAFAEARVDELLGRCSELIVEVRKLRADRSLVGSVAHGQVAAFMHALDQPVRDMPGLPLLVDGTLDERTVRLRAMLPVEEAFELAEAIFDKETADGLREMKVLALNRIQMCGTIDVDLPKVVDALADITYVVEGAWLTFGVSPQPVIDEVHRANMAKLGGPIDDSGKRLKPKDWTPPHIAGVLERQGWKTCVTCTARRFVDAEPSKHTCGRPSGAPLAKE
jgi:predicted HAD superfamily Cof-like phosphohydrolase